MKCAVTHLTAELQIKHMQKDKGFKNLHLRIDNETYEKLKSVKDRGGYKSWEEFFTKVVFSMSEDEIKKKRIEQLKERLFDIIDQLELLTDRKYELE